MPIPPTEDNHVVRLQDLPKMTDMDFMRQARIEDLVEQYGPHDVRMQTYENIVRPNEVRVANVLVARWDAAITPGMQGIVLHKNGSMYIRDGASIHRYKYVDGALRRLATYTHESVQWSRMIIIDNAIYFLAEGANTARTQLVALDIETLGVLRRSEDLDTGTHVSAHTSIDWGFGTTKLYFARANALLVGIDLVTFERISITLANQVNSATAFVGILDGHLIHMLRSYTPPATAGATIWTAVYNPDTLALVRARHNVNFPGAAGRRFDTFQVIAQQGGVDNGILVVRADMRGNTGSIEPRIDDIYHITRIPATNNMQVTRVSTASATPARPDGFAVPNGVAVHARMSWTFPNQIIASTSNVPQPRDLHNHNNVYYVLRRRPASNGSLTSSGPVATTVPQTNDVRNNDARIILLYDHVSEEFYPTYYLWPDTLNETSGVSVVAFRNVAEHRINPVQVQELTLAPAGAISGIGSTSRLLRSLPFPPYHDFNNTRLFVHGGRMYVQRPISIWPIPRFDDEPVVAPEEPHEIYVFADGHIVYDKTLIQSTDEYVTCTRLPAVALSAHEQGLHRADTTTGDIFTQKVLAIPRENAHCGCIWACECLVPEISVEHEEGY